MITRRNLLATTAAAAGTVVLAGYGSPARAEEAPAAGWAGRTSANGWPIDPSRITAHPVPATGVSVGLHPAAAAVLLHVARRWHYEVAPLDGGRGGGVTGHRARREEVTAPYESNYLSGSALCLHPAAFPIGGPETLWPHQEAVVRDILVDCGGTVVWGADLEPVKLSHFQLAVPPDHPDLARVSAQLLTSQHTGTRARTAGSVPDPAGPDRSGAATRLRRAQRLARPGR